MSDELKDAQALLLKAHEWMDALIVSGMSERAVSTALMTATTERALRSGGTAATAAWFDGQAERVRTFGDDWIKVFNA